MRTVKVVQSGRLCESGTLTRDHLYIPRAADDVLLSALLAGELGYVLAPRQIGKSSLRVRTQAALQSRGVRVANIDLTGIGAALSRDEWYAALIAELKLRLRLHDDAPARWQELPSPVQRWVGHLREELLPQTAPSPVVIFIDEIDGVLRLPFERDDFFAAIRAIYNDRADHPEWRRLTFCLLGVATPGQLIADPVRTPFNIGRRIELHDFTRQETEGFAPALAGLGSDPGSLLDTIYAWTAGHPYMTQRVCVELCREHTRGQPIDVERTVQTLFLRRGRSEDTNLSAAEKRLDAHPEPGHLLALYRRLLDHSESLGSTAERGEEPIRHELQLCGFVAERQDNADQRVLMVRNQIYARVFGPAWVKEKLGVRRLQDATARWQAAGRRSEALLGGLHLDEINAWAKTHPRDVNVLEHEFLHACLEARLAQEEERRLAAEASLADERRKAAHALVHTEQSLRASLLAERPEQLLQALYVGMQAVYEALPQRRFEALAWEGLINAAVAARLSRPLEGHTGLVPALAFSPDGQQLASVGSDGTLRLWELPGGRLLRMLDISTLDNPDPIGVDVHVKAKGVHVVSFSADGRRILTARDAGIVQLWDAQRLVCLGHLDHFNLGPDVERDAIAVLGAALSPDDRLAATVAADGMLRLWSIDTGALLDVVEASTVRLRSVAWSPTEAQLATTGDDGLIRLWAWPNGQALQPLEGHEGVVYSVDFSPDGLRLVSAAADGTARLWEVATGRFLASLQDHEGPVFSARFAPDAKQIVTAGADGIIRYWDARRARLQASIQAHAGGALMAIFSPDGRAVASTGADGIVRLWDFECSPLRRRQRSPSGSGHAAFLADGQHLLVVDAQGRAWCSTLDGRGTRQVLHDGVAGSLQDVGSTPAGQIVVSTAPDGSIHLYRLANGKSLRVLTGHTGPVLAACLAPDGDQVVSAGTDGSVRRWQVATGELLGTCPTPSGRVLTVSFVGDVPCVVTIDPQGVLRVWAIPSGEVIDSLPLEQERSEALRAATLSRDGRMLATASALGVVRLRELPGGSLQLLLRPPREELPGNIERLQFSPDMRQILITNDESMIVVQSIRHEAYYRFACDVLRSAPAVAAIAETDLLETLLGACPEPSGEDGSPR